MQGGMSWLGWIADRAGAGYGCGANLGEPSAHLKFGIQRMAHVCFQSAFFGHYPATNGLRDVICWVVHLRLRLAGLSLGPLTRITLEKNIWPTAISYPPHQLWPAPLYNSSQHFIRLLPLFLHRQSMTITLLSLLEPSKQPVLPCQFPLMQMPVLLTSFRAEHLPGLYFLKGFVAVSTRRHSNR